MKKIYLFLSGLFFFVALTSCDKKSNQEEEVSPCGDQISYFKQYGLLNPQIFSDSSFYTYVEGNDRIFQISGPVVQDACPDEHINYSISSKYMNSTRNISMRIKYRYGPFGIYGGEWVPGKNQNSATSEYFGSDNFGIANAYQGVPGGFYITVEWILDNYQDYHEDSLYLNEMLLETKFSYKYYKFKSAE